MMISHPTEYAYVLDRANKATGDEKKIAEKVVENMRYGLIPKGPARRAVVFGGWNLHMFKPDVVDGGNFDEGAPRAFIAFSTGPEWCDQEPTGQGPIRAICAASAPSG